jgi:hypothetical protein
MVGTGELFVLAHSCEASRTAFVREEFVARGGVIWAVHKDMLDSLQGPATLASDLVWSVL